MSGYPGFNFQAFLDADEWLRERNVATFNPAVFELAEGMVPVDWTTLTGDFAELAERGHEFDKRAALVRDMTWISQSDAVILLEGWEYSTGARLEMTAAEWVGLDVLLLQRVDGKFVLSTRNGMTVL